MTGAQSFVEDAGSPRSNSALKITAADGAWDLTGIDASTTSLTIGSAGSFDLQYEGGSSAALTISGSLVNDGSIALIGDGTLAAATLSVGGTVTNDGSFFAEFDSETLRQAISGTGTFRIFNSFLTMDSSVSSGQTVDFEGNTTLVLAHANEFSGTLDEFAGGDAIDAQSFAYGSTSFNFLENSQGTGGTLTLTDGSLVANFLMTGSYTNSDFEKAMDSGTGTLIKFV
jgi:hypothetical protein